jgi:DNA replication protein DnaC
VVQRKPPATDPTPFRQLAQSSRPTDSEPTTICTEPLKRLETNCMKTNIENENEMITKTCEACGNSFETAVGVLEKHVRLCPTCVERRAEEDRRRNLIEAEAHRMGDWWDGQVCPRDFLFTVPSELPIPEMLPRVFAWKYGPRGLLLHGPTGRGKSRCAWLLLGREHMAGRRIKVLDHSAGFKYAECFAQSAAYATDWVNRLVRADILFLDDVFKARFTDSFEQAMFSVISARTERHKPIILTCNDTEKTLLDRLSVQRRAQLFPGLRQ